ncbi:MAG: response regulator transcription factor [Betaproteobacteria bacterium]|nr:response regulator transcription factor [Betaproteobacteria bacterium]MBL8532981.1 response regulator transcription factor [Betaproteobacteria bacterium]
MHERLLIVEDDAALAAMVAEYLGTAGYAVTHASTGAEGLRQAAAGTFDLVILDVMLPDIDGFDVCRSLRSRSQVPVLMLTARGDPADRIVGLELGADDYLPKPFEPRELLARIRAVMRRGRPVPAASESLRFGRLEVDRDTRTVHIDGEERFLTSHQFELLWILATHAGRVMSRDALMDQLKGHVTEAFDRSLDVHVSRIRSAIEDDPKNPRRILTVRGAGYVFTRTQD